MSTNVNREHPKGNIRTCQDRAGFVTVAQRIKSHRIRPRSASSGV